MSVCLHLSAADERLPEEQRALLKWKMSPITPNVVRSCLTRVGFTKLKSEEREGGTAGTTLHLAAHHLPSPPIPSITSCHLLIGMVCYSMYVHTYVVAMHKYVVCVQCVLMHALHKLSDTKSNIHCIGFVG